MRLHWDPDHDPRGEKLPRKAIQLGLRGATLRRFNQEWLLGVEDLSATVRELAPKAASGGWSALLTPEETWFTLRDPAVRSRLGL